MRVTNRGGEGYCIVNNGGERARTKGWFKGEFEYSGRPTDKVDEG